MFECNEFCSYCVAVLSNLLLSGVRSRCRSLQSLFFSLIFCLINIGQLGCFSWFSARDVNVIKTEE
jgi:hypothetical protein